MTNEIFKKRAREEDSQSIAAGTIPIMLCPACGSDDIGLNEASHHYIDREYLDSEGYCRICTTRWNPDLLAKTLFQNAQRLNRRRDATN